MNPILETLLKNSLVVTYKVSPTPKNLADSLLIYRGLSEIGNIIQYRLGICPVTKKRTSDLRVVFHDTQEQLDKSADSQLESKIRNSTNIRSSESDKGFKLNVEALSRDRQDVVQARTLSAASYFKVKKEGDSIQEMTKKVETRKNEILKGFKGLFVSNK